MNVRKAYNSWAKQYDTNQNKTRDIEAIALRETLKGHNFINCLEIGCGTGKNTQWLLTISNRITAIDFSEEMLEKAKAKINSGMVNFQNADIKKQWTFADSKYDLVTFSLVLEHIKEIDDIMRKVSAVISPQGYVYIGELHPFKQYTGTKARFDSEAGVQIVECYNHNISDFTQSALENGFELIDINEFFDDNDRTTIPRIFSLLLRKK